MATVFVPAPLRRLTGGQSKVEVEGTTVEQVLARLARDYPGVDEQLRDDAGAVRSYINIFVNGAEIRTLEGAQTPVGPQDEVSIIPAMAGGMGVPWVAGNTAVPRGAGG